MLTYVSFRSSVLTYAFFLVNVLTYVYFVTRVLTYAFFKQACLLTPSFLQTCLLTLIRVLSYAFLSYFLTLWTTSDLSISLSFVSVFKCRFQQKSISSCCVSLQTHVVPQKFLSWSCPKEPLFFLWWLSTQRNNTNDRPLFFLLLQSMLRFFWFLSKYSLLILSFLWSLYTRLYRNHSYLRFSIDGH